MNIFTKNPNLNKKKKKLYFSVSDGDRDGTIKTIYH